MRYEYLIIIPTVAAVVAVIGAGLIVRRTVIQFAVGFHQIHEELGLGESGWTK
ncbi:MAG: hypothetical protein NTV39_04095 [Candidatus Saccharibacteria bacterium]|nr:hypothetical protein [Candidatus Saccharibacteria bacterium]